MEIQHLIIVALIGITAGLLSGLLGLGGAIIIIPALVFFMGFSQQTAQGTALLMMVLPVVFSGRDYLCGCIDDSVIMKFSDCHTIQA